MKELTKKQKENIDGVICNRMDDLEDTINEAIKEVLADIGLKNNQDALVLAREIFFRG